MTSRFTSRILLAAILGSGLAITGCSKESKLARHTARADAYAQSGEYSKAEVEYLNALRYAPKDPVLIRKLANMFADQGRAVTALAFFAEISQSNPNDLDARSRLAQLRFAIHDYQGARKDALIVATNQLTNSAAMLIAAECSVTSTQRIETLRFIEQARQKTPHYAPLLAGAVLSGLDGNLSAAEEQLRRATALNPPAAEIDLAWSRLRLAETNLIEAENLLKRAADASPAASSVRVQWIDLFFLRGDLAGARRALEAATSKAPEYIPYWIRLANLELRQNNLDECDKVTRRVLALDGRNHEALLIRARMWNAQGRPKDAIDELTRLDATLPNNGGVKYELAMAEAMSGDRTKAIALAEESLKLNPNFAPAVVLFAELNLRAGNSAAAIPRLAALVKARPEVREAAGLLASAYSSTGRPDDAIAIYRNLAARAPNDPEPWYSIGLVNLRVKRDVAAARTAFEQSARIDPNYLPTAERLINLDLAAKNDRAAMARAQAIHQSFTNSAAGLLLAARVHLASNGFPSAENVLRAALQREPNSLPVHELLADIYVQWGEYDKGLQMLDKVIALNTNAFDAWSQKGIVFEMRGERAKAIEAYQRALALNPKFPVPLNNLANLFSTEPGKLDEAIAFATRARASAPNDVSITDTLGWLLLKRGDFNEARRLLNSAADSSKNSEIHYHAGLANYAVADEAGARRWFEKARSDDKLRPELRRDIDSHLALLNIPAQSPSVDQVRAIETSIAEQPRDYLMQYRLGTIYLNRGRTDDAAKCFEAASQVNSQAYQPVLMLARIHAVKEPKRALELARRARTLAPADPAAALMLGTLLLRTHDYPAALAPLVEGQRAENPPRAETLVDLAMAQFANGRIAEATNTVARAVAQASGVAQQSAREALLLLTGAPQAGALAEARLKADPEDAVALAASALATDVRNDKAKAIELFTQVLARAPGFAPAHRRLAVLHFETGGDEKAAYSHALKAREAFPNDPQVATVLGRIALKRNNFSDALRFFQEASVQTSNGEPFYLLGLANVGLKRTNDARVAFTRAGTLPLKPEIQAENTRRLAELK